MALTDEQLELLGNRLVPLYQELEQDVIADIARRVKKTGRYTETAELMARALMEQGYSPARIQREVMKVLRADKEYQMAVAEHTKEYKQYVASEISRVVAEAKEQGNDIVADAGNMAFNADLSMWGQAGKSLSQPSGFHQLVDAMAVQTNGELKNLTKSLGFKNVGFTALENVYQHQLDLGLIKLTSGAYSWQRVVDDCVRELAQSGLRTIDYKSGRSMQLDTAVRNCIRTASGQLAGKVIWTRQEKALWKCRNTGVRGRTDPAVTAIMLTGRAKYTLLIGAYTGRNQGGLGILSAIWRTLPDIRLIRLDCVGITAVTASMYFSRGYQNRTNGIRSLRLSR